LTCLKLDVVDDDDKEIIPREKIMLSYFIHPLAALYIQLKTLGAEICNSSSFGPGKDMLPRPASGNLFKLERARRYTNMLFPPLYSSNVGRRRLLLNSFNFARCKLLQLELEVPKTIFTQFEL